MNPVWGIETCYKILGLKKKCKETDVKKAYRRMSLKHHPDIDKDKLAKRKFILIRLAYEWVMYDLALRQPHEKHTKPRTYFGDGIASAYHKVWDNVLHSKEFINWDKKHPKLSKKLYGNRKPSSHVIDMKGMGFFDRQGFWHDHVLEDHIKVPKITLNQIIAGYKYPTRQSTKKHLLLKNNVN